MASKSVNSQITRVLNHLNKYGSITSWEAFEKMHITRLSSIIYSLRKDGYNIGSVTEEHIIDNGNVSRFARYTLIKGDEE